MSSSLASPQFYVLDPSSHRVNGAAENIGDLIIKHHVDILLDASGLIDYKWVDYTYLPKKGDSVIIGGANVFGNILSKAHSFVWHPSLLKQFKSKCLNILPLGVGWWSYQHGPSLLTKYYYKSVFRSSQYMGVRDKYTLNKLNLMGFDNAYLTGCPSMYSHNAFTTARPSTALLTLTNYRQNPLRDQMLIGAILQQFDEIVFFPQGSSDLQYFNQLISYFALPEHRFRLLDRSFASLNAFIQENEFMHVGTRLHMGMHCLSHGKPSVCIAIDNRASEMKESFPSLPIVDILELPDMLSKCHKYSFIPDKKVPFKLTNLVQSIL